MTTSCQACAAHASTHNLQTLTHPPSGEILRRMEKGPVSAAALDMLSLDVRLMPCE
jgi:hypothetical protein